MIIIHAREITNGKTNVETTMISHCSLVIHNENLSRSVGCFRPKIDALTPTSRLLSPLTGKRGIRRAEGKNRREVVRLARASRRIRDCNLSGTLCSRERFADPLPDPPGSCFPRGLFFRKEPHTQRSLNCQWEMEMRQRNKIYRQVAPRARERDRLCCRISAEYSGQRSHMRGSAPAWIRDLLEIPCKSWRISFILRGQENTRPGAYYLLKFNRARETSLKFRNKFLMKEPRALAYTYREIFFTGLLEYVTAAERTDTWSDSIVRYTSEGL